MKNEKMRILQYLVKGADDNAGYWPGHAPFEITVYASSREEAREKAIKKSEGGNKILSIDSVRKIAGEEKKMEAMLGKAKQMDQDKIFNFLYDNCENADSKSMPHEPSLICKLAADKDGDAWQHNSCPIIYGKKCLRYYTKKEIEKAGEYLPSGGDWYER